MAYMDQTMKKEKAPGIKKVLNKYKMKGSITVSDYSTLIVTLKSGPIDFGTTNTQVNVYAIERNYEGVAKKFLMELVKVMMKGNYNNSDSQIDHFDVGYYISINIGKWNVPYKVVD